MAGMSHMPSESNPQARWTPQPVHELTGGALDAPAAALQLAQYRIPVFPCVSALRTPTAASRSVPQSTTLIPTRADVTFDELIRFDWALHTDDIDYERQGVNTGSTSGLRVRRASRIA